MKPFPPAWVVLALLGLCLTSAHADAPKPEDLPIPDDDAPAAPAPATPPVAATPTPTAAPAKSTTTAPTKPTNATPTPSSGTGNPDEVVTLTRGQLDALLRQQAELQRQIDELKANAKGGGPTAPGVTTTPGVGDENPPPLDTPASGTDIGNTGSATDGTSGSGTAGTGSSSGSPANASGNRSLLLPDISFIGQGIGLYSTDSRAEGRSSFRLSEGEIGIQGYVYPKVKADAFISGSPSENEAFQIEETYLTFIGVRPGLNIYAGRKFVPFGRTDEQHNHSWLYTRQLLPIRNLITPENLQGDGVNFRYTRPFGKLFTQADFGVFSGAEDATLNTTSGAFDPAQPFGTDFPTGTGASFGQRFYNGRLYAAIPSGANGEFALGASYAHGRSELRSSETDDIIANGNASIYGFDATYRHYMGIKRVLARAEYFGYRPDDSLPTRNASGYYGLLNYRFDPRHDIGLLYENSGFPQSGDHEHALSLIYTKQFTEQFYARIQGSHGSRPGENSYNEVFLQFVFGLGPHTHSLE